MSLENNNLQNEEEINDFSENKDDKTIQEQQIKQIKNTDQLLEIINEDLRNFIQKYRLENPNLESLLKQNSEEFHTAFKNELTSNKENIDALHTEMTENGSETTSAYNKIKKSLFEAIKDYYGDNALWQINKDEIQTNIKKYIDGLKNKIETSKKNVNKIKIEEKTEEKKEEKKEDKKIEVKKEIKIEPMKVKNNIEKKQKKSNKKSFKEINFEQIIKSCTERESVDVKKCISIIKQQYYDFKDAEKKLLLSIIKKQNLKAINIPKDMKIGQYEDKDVFVNTPKHFSNDVNGKLKFSKNESNLQNTKYF